MGHLSELELFLKSQEVEGQLEETDSSFTVARERALEKLASFQLPFDYAWAVKLIQAAVRSGGESPIRIDLKARQLDMYCELPGVTLEAFEQAFYDPDAPRTPTLKHLVSGLWVVALREKHPFQLTLPGSSKSLIWDGEALRQIDSAESHSVAHLTISYFPRNSSFLNILNRPAAAARLNRNLAGVLSDYCYVCPLPLSVDARRVDSLLQCPEYGWSHSTSAARIPLWVGSLNSEIPTLPISPGTLRPGASSYALGITVGGSNVSTHWEARLAMWTYDKQQHGKDGDVPYVLTMRKQAIQHPQGSQISEPWSTQACHSKLFWVQDGAVVDSQPLYNSSSGLGVAVYVNADGLETDLTGIRLLVNDAQRQRQELVIEQLREELSTQRYEPLKEELKDMVLREERIGKAKLVGLGALGVAGAFFSPWASGLAATWGIVRAKNSIHLTRSYPDRLANLLRTARYALPDPPVDEASPGYPRLIRRKIP